MKRILYLILLMLVIIQCPVSARLLTSIKVGAEQTSRYLPLLKGKRVGLVINNTARIGQLSLLDVLLKNGVTVATVFAPEHGFRGTADAGEQLQNSVDSSTGTPIVSLYGNNKKPTADQMRGVDIMVFDIQDVGARFYTYISTLYYVMQACSESGKSLIVLDRPNPCDYVDGPVLNLKFRSFVGMLPIPVLHGCTIGELARMINGERWLPGRKICKLSVITLSGWHHGQSYSLPVKPSPNLPNDQSIRLYVSLCPFEATSISVGRGTYFPFQVLGAPDKRFGTFSFTPRALAGFDKNPLHKDEECFGIDLRNVKDIKGFSLRYLMQFYKLWGGGDSFFTRAEVFDKLLGTDTVRKAMLAGKGEKAIRASWQTGLNKYKVMRKKYLLYK